ncbi:RecX family transcriptional regulator [Sphingomonas sp. ASV193]|uniref:RecX family transcriptional regulator n=1 Tax=Sphingomonas sp. ASV193 TaxID=3144405 RepID=UPI0032E8F1AA
METRNRRTRRPRPPLTEASLNDLALAYVGRFATSRAKLADYLGRKLRERGWEGDRGPDPRALAERLAGLGYVDDRAFADGKARALGARGYGARRVGMALHVAGIAEADRAGADAIVAGQAVEAALRFARRRRLGPFSTAPTGDPKQRERAMAAMIRAGHPPALSRAILDCGDEAAIDRESLQELIR